MEDNFENINKRMDDIERKIITETEKTSSMSNFDSINKRMDDIERKITTEIEKTSSNEKIIKICEEKLKSLESIVKGVREQSGMELETAQKFEATTIEELEKELEKMNIITHDNNDQLVTEKDQIKIGQKRIPKLQSIYDKHEEEMKNFRNTIQEVQEMINAMKEQRTIAQETKTSRIHEDLKKSLEHFTIEINGIKEKIKDISERNNSKTKTITKTTEDTKEKCKIYSQIEEMTKNLEELKEKYLSHSLKISSNQTELSDLKEEIKRMQINIGNNEGQILGIADDVNNKVISAITRTERRTMGLTSRLDGFWKYRNRGKTEENGVGINVDLLNETFPPKRYPNTKVRFRPASSDEESIQLAEEMNQNEELKIKIGFQGKEDSDQFFWDVIFSDNGRTIKFYIAKDSHPKPLQQQHEEDPSAEGRMDKLIEHSNRRSSREEQGLVESLQSQTR